MPRTSSWLLFRSRRLGLVLLILIGVTLPAAFGASKMRWSSAGTSYSEDRPPPPRIIEEYGQIQTLTPILLGSIPGEPLRVERPLPAKVDTYISIRSTVDLHLEVPDNSAPDNGMRLLGRLPASLAFASDPSRGLLLSAGIDGTLHWFDAETLRLVGSCLLPGPAYQLVCDSTRRRLYAALTEPAKLQLGPLSDRFSALGDIHVFDFDQLLALTPATGPAQAIKRIPCKAHIWSMTLSTDRSSLYYLAETDQDVRIVCFDVLDRKSPKSIPMQGGGTNSLAPALDGKTLFGLAGNRLFAIDVASWSIRWMAIVGSNIHSLTVGPADQLYLVERRQALYLLVLDPATKRVVSRCAFGLQGRPYLCRSPDGRRVYFSNSAVTTGHLLALEVAASDPHRPRLAGWLRSGRDHLVRGEIRLSADGKFLLTSVGQLFRVGS